MPKITLTLSGPVAKTLKVYSAQIRSSLRAQSQVVEEALIEFFEKRGFKINDIEQE
jgi:maleate cis-trans isomerase